jgi:hypothetical protein
MLIAGKNFFEVVIPQCPKRLFANIRANLTSTERKKNFTIRGAGKFSGEICWLQNGVDQSIGDAISGPKRLLAAVTDILPFPIIEKALLTSKRLQIYDKCL